MKKNNLYLILTLLIPSVYHHETKPTIFHNDINSTYLAAAVAMLGIGGALLWHHTATPAQKYYDHDELYWYNWENLEQEGLLSAQSLAKPFIERANYLYQQGKEFVWGAGSSAHQMEGNCTNNTYYLWEQAKCPSADCPVMVEPAGMACDHWNRYQEDIELLAQAGLNTFRLSLEWSKIEPEPGVFDLDAIQHYREVLTELKKRGLKALVVLHHYTEPIWFALKGGFTKPENIDYFVQFSKKSFEEFHELVDYWFTFNGPAAHASRVYMTNVAPPSNFEELDPQLIANYQETGETECLVEALRRHKPNRNMAATANLIKNILSAHVEVYHTLKALPNGEKSCIGLMKNIHQIDPHDSNNLLHKIPGYINAQLNDEPIFRFFETGTFTCQIFIPWFNMWVNIEHTDERAKNSLDIIGVNYYSHRYMTVSQRMPHPRDEETDNENYSIYPEGLERAIETVHNRIAQPCNVPMMITENGIATTDNAKRHRFISRYLYVLGNCINKGYPINGYCHWALTDNWEWGTKKGNKPYGIYHVNFDPKDANYLKRTFKPGAQIVKDIGNLLINS